MTLHNFTTLGLLYLMCGMVHLKNEIEFWLRLGHMCLYTTLWMHVAKQNSILVYMVQPSGWISRAPTITWSQTTTLPHSVKWLHAHVHQIFYFVIPIRFNWWLKMQYYVSIWQPIVCVCLHSASLSGESKTNWLGGKIGTTMPLTYSWSPLQIMPQLESQCINKMK